MFLKLLVLLLLGLLLYQDLRYRAVYWIIFPLLFISLFCMELANRSAVSMITDGLFNCLFLLVQLAMVTLYFSVKHKRFIWITRGHLGWGDVLFLATIAIALPIDAYLQFYLFSLLLILIAVWVSGSLGSNKIPLAGLQAGLFAFLVITDWRLFSVIPLNSFAY